MYLRVLFHVHAFNYGHETFYRNKTEKQTWKRVIFRQSLVPLIRCSARKCRYCLRPLDHFNSSILKTCSKTLQRRLLLLLFFVTPLCVFVNGLDARGVNTPSPFSREEGKRGVGGILYRWLRMLWLLCPSRCCIIAATATQ